MLLECLLVCLGPETSRFVFADRYEDAFAEAVARNVPVLVIDCDGWETGGGLPQVSAFYSDPSFVAAAQNAVLILASHESHGEKKEIRDGVEQLVCAVYGGTSCAAHQAMLAPLVRDGFGENGEVRTPLFLVITPQRKLSARIAGETRPATVLIELEQAKKKLGPGMPRSDYVRFKRGLDDIRRMIELEEYGAAVGISFDLEKIPGSFPPQADLKSVKKTLDEKAASLAQHAAARWAADHAFDALLEMDDVRMDFARLPSAVAAAARLAEWEKSAEAKPFADALKADRIAHQLYQQGLELERQGELKRAVSALERLLQLHPESRFAKRARLLRGTLKDRK